MRPETMTETAQKPRWHAWLARLSFLALMIWAVTTWITGYVFAPLMFAILPLLALFQILIWLRLARRPEAR